MPARPGSRPLNGETNGAPALSAALIESLTAHRSAALSAALLDHPEAALALLVERLALPVFYNGPYGEGVLQITPRVASFHRVEGSTAFAAHRGRARALEVPPARRERSSPRPGASCRASATLQGLLTFCVAQTVNAVLLKGERATDTRMEQARTLAGLLNLDMAAWFTPTSANYFGRASKAIIIGNLEEIKGAVAPAWNAMKKTDLASLAEREAAGSAGFRRCCGRSSPCPRRNPSSRLDAKNGGSLVRGAVAFSRRPFPLHGSLHSIRECVVRPARA